MMKNFPLKDEFGEICKKYTKVRNYKKRLEKYAEIPAYVALEGEEEFMALSDPDEREYVFKEIRNGTVVEELRGVKYQEISMVLPNVWGWEDRKDLEIFTRSYPLENGTTEVNVNYVPKKGLKKEGR